MSQSYVDCYYSRTLNPVNVRSALSGEAAAEVCVIGGGLAGLAVALGLAERGRRVVLLEAERLGWGASGRNGGFVAPGFSLSAEALAARVGQARARELYGLTLEAMALIRQRIDRYAIDCQPRAGIVGASWFDDRAAVEASAAFHAEQFGERVEIWRREKLRALCRSRSYFDGIFLPDSFQMHPLNFALGIAAAAEAAGAEIFEATRVTACRAGTRGFRIETAGGVVSTDQVVFCCSGYIGTLQPRLARATLPVGTYVMLTEPLGERLETAIRAPYPLSDDRVAGDYYRVLPDTRLLWGGRVSAFAAPHDLAGALLSDLLKVYPQLAGIRAEVAWQGTMGYATHKMPQIGRLGPGLWYCMGFGGHGLCPTTMGGELVASAIAEGDERYRLFEPFGLCYCGGALAPVIAQSVYWGYRLQDRLRSGWPWRRRNRAAEL